MAAGGTEVGTEVAVEAAVAAPSSVAPTLAATGREVAVVAAIDDLTTINLKLI